MMTYEIDKREKEIFAAMAHRFCQQSTPIAGAKCWQAQNIQRLTSARASGSYRITIVPAMAGG